MSGSEARRRGRRPDSANGQVSHPKSEPLTKKPKRSNTLEGVLRPSVKKLQRLRRFEDALQLLLDLRHNKDTVEIRLEIVALLNALADVHEALQVKESLLRQCCHQDTTARDALAMLLLQQNRQSEAQSFLQQNGYTHRLSQQVILYNSTKTEESDLCWALDNVFTPSTVTALQTFLKPGSPYWTLNDYDEISSSGYFSNVFDLHSSPRFLVEEIITDLFTLLKRTQDRRARSIRYAEWWAHCRPHAIGHQMHYDSENEGQGAALRHPLFSCVVYLSQNVGGPTLMTDQMLAKPRLAKHGWLIPPKINRVAFFDAKYLHGVVPGHGLPRDRADRRISFMVGFWDHITVQRKEGRGASRPLPEDATWVTQAPVVQGERLSKSQSPALPFKVDNVWTDIDGQTLTTHRLPSYEQCFQGF